MHHNTVETFTLRTPTDGDGFFFDLGSFNAQADLLTDPRDARQTLRHQSGGGASLLCSQPRCGPQPAHSSAKLNVGKP